jgi:hypothetical protein
LELLKGELITAFQSSLIFTVFDLNLSVNEAAII